VTGSSGTASSPDAPPGRPVQFAVPIPQFSWPALDLRGLRGYLERAEELGFHGAWAQEESVGEHGALEPLALLSHAAACTARLRLGVAVLLTALRSPVPLARTLATIDHLSQGRLEVGVGLGAPSPFDAAFGLRRGERVARFTEGLEIVRRLWTEERATVPGRFWRLDGLPMAPKPLQRPHPPIWIGAHDPRALRRAVELGDGFFGAGAASTEQFEAQVAVVRRHLRELGRDPAGFRVAKRVYVMVEPDRALGLRRLREWFGRYYRDEALADRVALVGSVDHCVAGLRRVIAAGARLVLLNFVFDERASLEVAARELVPRLRG
jgi:alkanesulfonate monooxygenase SsuD/methylene tetrahydromethanopterin reductase-like flavin-dependent oxidoreductase (luciferase family)